MPADNPLFIARGEAGDLVLWHPQSAGNGDESVDRYAVAQRTRARGGDEINIPQKGKNYGWPLATHGVNYSGLAIPEAQGTAVAGTEAPLSSGSGLRR